MLKFFYKLGENLIKILALMFTALIFASALIYTAYNYEMTSHKFELLRDNIAYSLAGVLVVLGIGALLYFIVKKNFQKRLRLLLALVVIWYFFACEYLAFFGRTMPNADSWIVYAMAKQIAVGDLSIIHPTMSYMSYYPQQIGLCTFLSFFIRIINLFPFQIEAFHFLVALYGVFECVTVFALYKTVNNMFNSYIANFAFLFFSMLNLPYILYSSFLYGEIPALMFFAIGSYFLSNVYSGKGKLTINIFFCTAMFALSVWVRKNSIILIIGVLIVLVFEAMKAGKIKYLISAGFIGICAFLILPVTIKCYEEKAGRKLSKGVTALSYIAMGMQEPVGDTNAGWYSGFNFNTFEEAGCNTDKANKIARQAIVDRLKELKDKPDLAKAFCREKFLTQWVDGTYFSRESTYVYYGARSEFLRNIYEGNLGKYYIYVCNIYQSVIFLGAFMWACYNFRSKSDFSLSKAFIFVGIFGGFLFHMMWEANSRYIITYACLLVIYAAKGYASIVDK